MESIASSKQVEWEALRLTRVDFKERLMNKDVFFCSWLSTKDMLVDMMIKKIHLLPAMQDVFLRNGFSLLQPPIDEVKQVSLEIRMEASDLKET